MLHCTRISGGKPGALLEIITLVNVLTPSTALFLHFAASPRFSRISVIVGCLDGESQHLDIVLVVSQQAILFYASKRER